jgi:nucleoside 2-deoxyribosyltransferase/DNA-binding CsgD family transcriptional regulator
MQERPKIYLAGPEVFLPEAKAIGQIKKDLCAKCGFEGLFPFDNEAPQSGSGDGIDRLIYRANVAMIDAADCGIFNLTPFRGASADAGTIFELGVMTGLGKAAFAYSNDGGTLLDRLKRDHLAAFDKATSQWWDQSGMAIENFENADNLMLDACLAEQGHPIVRRQVIAARRFVDLEGFVICLERARQHFSIKQPSQDVRAVLTSNALGPKPGPPAAILAKTFRLTPSEAKLACIIARGAPPHIAARELKISPETARNQLKSILAKMDTHRQSELVALLLQVE